MKFESYLKSINGVEIYPMFSLIAFLVFFLLVTYFVIKMSKKEVEELSLIPFSNNLNNNIVNKTDGISDEKQN